MSLELAITANTDAVKELVAVWKTLASMGKTINSNIEAGTQTSVPMAGGVEIPVAAPAAAAKTTAAPKSSKAAATPTAAATETVKVEPVAASPSEVDPLADDDSAEEITYAAVAAAVTALSKAKGRSAAVAVLAKFDVTALPSAKPEQFADIKSACEAELV